MGVFLETAVCQNAGIPLLKKELLELERLEPSFSLKESECSYNEFAGGVRIYFNEGIVGYDKLACSLSDRLGLPVLLAYIYDDDFWGYYFYDSGKELDCFSAFPDYFGEPKEITDRMVGSPDIIAERFGVLRERIEGYYQPRTMELLDSEEDTWAYPDDRFPYGDCWQMEDFLKKLGFPAQEPEEAPPAPAVEQHAAPVQRSDMFFGKVKPRFLQAPPK